MEVPAEYSADTTLLQVVYFCALSIYFYEKIN